MHTADRNGPKAPEGGLEGDGEFVLLRFPDSACLEFSRSSLFPPQVDSFTGVGRKRAGDIKIVLSYIFILVYDFFD